MKLNAYCTNKLKDKPISKTLLTMKLTTLALLATFTQVSAASFGQTVNLTKRSAPLKEVFKEIRKQTGFDFVFTEQQISGAKPISIQGKNMPLKDVLATCFETQPFSYFIQNKTIVVTAKKVEKVAETVQKQQVIIGVVTDVQGKPIAGASVTMMGDGTKRAAQTDMFGKYSILAAPGETIIFSSVGYETKLIPINNNKVINAQLELKVNTIEDVVVVGYGSMQRKDLTGSVASVKVDEIKNVPFATVDQALTGKAAGVQVTQADGSPGGVAKIRVRGGTSLLGGNDPLYIVDGVQITIQNRYQEAAADLRSPTEGSGNDESGTTISGSFARGLNSLGGLNFNDIESIDILKDASATAIYGSKGANGVVIITTKKGKNNQKPVFDANYYLGLSAPIKEKLLNRDQYIMIMKEAAQNLNDARAALNPARPPDAKATAILNDPNYFGTANTDWLDLVLRTAATQNGDISVRGGGTNSRYYTSLGLTKNNGVIRGTDYNRIAGKVSLDNEITSRFRVNTNLNYGFTSNNMTNGMYTQALFAPPTFNPYNEDGSIQIFDPAKMSVFAYQGFQNPLALLKGVNQSDNASLIGSLAAELDIRKDLTFRSSVAVNFNSYHQNNYVPSNVVVSSDAGAISSNNGIATRAQSKDVNTFYENTLTWKKEFNENNRLNLVGGTAWQISKSNFFSASGQGFPDDEYLNNLSAAAITLPAQGRSGQNSLLSFYLRANYSLMDRYIFTFTGRSDASSKFPKGNRVGYFPSGGVAWRLSKENFLKDVTWLNELKLRASMGSTGTQNIGDNLFYTLYSPVSYAGRNGMAASQLGNDRIRWEATRQKDAGINFSLFDSRINGELGYYEKSTSGVLFPATVASSSGSAEVTANVAHIRNRGLELALSADFIRRKDFQWTGAINISGNRSKVLALSSEVTDPNNPDIYLYGNAILKVGQPLGLLYGRQFDKILQTQAEVDAYKERSWFGKSLLPYTGIGDASYLTDNPTAGSYLDDVIGNGEAKYYGGYTNTLNYKNFGLSFLMTFSKGNDILWLYDIPNQNAANATNKSVKILDRWTPENPDSERPRLILGQSSLARTASNNVYDASYLKLKSVTFSYRLSNKLMSKWGVNNAMAYISATNLLTFTKYPGADPEVSNNPYSLIGGYSDTGSYPTVRQFSLGVRVGF